MSETNMNEYVLEVSGLRKVYPKFELRDVSFRVPRGCIMGFIGRNGAGKTTTIKSVLGLVHPNAGSVRFFGMDLADQIAAAPSSFGGYQKIDTATFFG